MIKTNGKPLPANGLSRIAVKSAETNYNFNVYSIGCEQTYPGKSVGPCVRSKYVVHYVLGGSGTFCGAPVKRGDGFLICPNQLHSYASSESDPLKYGWISFYGYGTEELLAQAGFRLENQTFSFGWAEQLDRLFDAVCRSDYPGADESEYLVGCFHILISFHIKALRELNAEQRKGNAKRAHVKSAIKYIDENYCHNISVADVAAAVCVSAHYLSNLFHEELGVSPQKYLLTVRMNRAAELLALDGMLIADIAHSVGYDDPLGFSKMFKRCCGVSPKVYRERGGSR